MANLGIGPKAYQALVGLFKQNEKDGRYPDQNSIDLFMILRDMSTCIVTKVYRSRKTVVFNQPGDDLFYSPSSEVSYSVSLRSRISFEVTPPGAETSLTPVTPSPATVQIHRPTKRAYAARSLNFENSSKALVLYNPIELKPKEDVLELSSSPRISNQKNHKSKVYWRRFKMDLFRVYNQEILAGQDSVLKALTLAPLA